MESYEEKIFEETIKAEQALLDEKHCNISDNRRFLEIKLITNIIMDLRINECIVKAPRPLTCKKGCTPCCFFRIDANVIEAFTAWEYLNLSKGIKGNQREEILERLTKYPDKYANLAQNQIENGLNFVYFKDQLECPFLIQNSCSIYLARPSACRGLTNYRDVVQCRNFSGVGEVDGNIMSISKHLGNTDNAFQKEFSKMQRELDEPFQIALDAIPFLGIFPVLVDISSRLSVMKISEARKIYNNYLEANNLDSKTVGQNKVFKDFNNITSEDSVLGINHIKVGRNEPCPCGSGIKYKKCCGKS